MSSNRHKPETQERNWGPLSVGAWLILSLAAISSLVVLTWSTPEHSGLEFWVFSRHHAMMYRQNLTPTDEADQDKSLPDVDVIVLDSTSLVRRTLSGFWAKTPVADMIEIERSQIGKFVAGPLDSVGFTDLTDILEREKIRDRLNAPSFSPWTSRGRVFGIPHDVHPVLLCYRADIVEAAGIDVSQIRTWEDFRRVMMPLQKDLDGDGRVDRYAIGIWYTTMGLIEPLLLQAGGGTFDDNGDSLVASDANAKVIATVVSWCFGPNRIAIDAPEFSPSGNQLKVEGRVIAALMPDWLAGVWMKDLPQLSGKLKLMPLPAWEPGGRRTGVWGGTMLGIPRQTKRFDEAWALAKKLYLSKDMARALFKTNHIISPVVEYWDEDFYREPRAYFSGQQTGLLYIAQAPHVPHRTSSPFHTAAMARISEAINELKRHADTIGKYDRDTLMPKARQLLEAAEKRVLKEMARNVFLSENKP